MTQVRTPYIKSAGNKWGGDAPRPRSPKSVTARAFDLMKLVKSRISPWTRLFYWHLNLSSLFFTTSIHSNINPTLVTLQHISPIRWNQNHRPPSFVPLIISDAVLTTPYWSRTSGRFVRLYKTFTFVYHTLSFTVRIQRITSTIIHNTFQLTSTCSPTPSKMRSQRRLRLYVVVVVVFLVAFTYFTVHHTAFTLVKFYVLT